MEQLINYLQQFGNFNTQQIELVCNSAVTRRFKKGDYFSEAGQISKEIAFITGGILRICYYDKDGSEITKYFVDENNFAVDVNSYFNNIPSSEYIEAITDVNLLIFSKTAMDNLSNTILIWDSVVNQIANKAMTEKFNITSMMIAEDATTRYLNFYNRFPALANRIPLNYLASYIGVTKQSLSRIREEIIK